MSRAVSTTELRVLMTQRAPEVAVERLRAACSAGTFTMNPEPDTIWSKEQLLEQLRSGDFNALYAMLTNKIDAEVFEAAPNLRIVANMAVGYNNIDVDEATRRGVMVTNTPGVLTDTTADFAWSLLMSVARRVVEGDRFTRAGKFHGWGPLMLVGQDVHGKTLGIVGFGRIGRAVAKRASGFDMRVLYHDKHPADPETEKALNARSVEMDELLNESDYVSLHTDYNPESHHLIGAPEFEMMKNTAFLINTSRGAIVDEAALVAALENGAIAGAGLDVYEREPELHSGLSKLENAVLAPHIASASLDTRNAMAMMAAENIIAALSGKQPPNLVNPESYKQ